MNLTENTNYKQYKDDRHIVMYTRQMSFLSNIVISLLFVTIAFNVATVLPSTYAMISLGHNDREGHIKQYCEHAGGMYKGLDESHYACTFIDHAKYSQ